MQTTLIAVVGLLATAVAAAPGYPGGGSSYTPCYGGLESTPQCCAVDVLGVADLNCQLPPQTPYSAEDFQAICANIGKQATCCAIPILEQSILCVGLPPQ